MVAKLVRFEDGEWNKEDVDNILESLTFKTLVHPTIIHGTFSTTEIGFVVRFNTGDKIEYIRKADQYNVTQEHHVTINGGLIDLMDEEEKALDVVAELFQDSLIGRLMLMGEDVVS